MDPEKVSSTWGEAAQQLGFAVPKSILQLQPNQMYGRLDGCDVHVRYQLGWGENSSPKTRYVVRRTSGAIPVDLVRPRKISRIWSWSFRSGDPAWDRQFVVKGRDRAAAHQFLTSDRRAVFDRIQLNLGDDWQVKNQSLEVSTSGRASGKTVENTVRELVKYVNGITTGPIPNE